MLNLKNYTTWLQYRCKFAMVRTNVVKNLLFYILFSLLFLHFFFSLLSHSPVPSLFGGEASETDTCQEQNSGADSDYCREHILREARERQEVEIRPPKQKITDAIELSEYRPRSISHARSRRSHPEAVVDPLPFLLCPPFTLPLSGCGFFFFFLTTIWVDLMVVVDCGLLVVTVAVEVDCRGDGRWWLSTFFFFFFFCCNLG